MLSDLSEDNILYSIQHKFALDDKKTVQ